MAPPPTATDLFFARNQTPILLGTFATQVCHHQYIKRTEPSLVTSAASTIRATPIPRTLRAGLGWGVVFIGLLTKITLAKQAVTDYKDPIVTNSLQRKAWKKVAEA